MMYEIESYVGIGPIRLGMAREEIHTIILEERKQTKGRGSDKIGDHFPSLGLFVNYREGLCEFVEMFGPLCFPYSDFQGQTFLPTFQNQTFLGRPYRQMLAWLKRRDPDMLVEDGISLRLGIALYDGVVDDHFNRVESVSVFEKGYYDKVWHLLKHNRKKDE